MENSELIRLINSAKEGSSEAISRLFAEYKNEVYSVAMRETKDRSLSDDIVQETFVEVILKINDLKNPASFPAWLKMIAYHQCTRHYKKKETVHETAAIENDDGLSVFDTVEETNASFIPDDALDQKEFKATILKMIDELPDAQRATLHMFYFEEMPLKVIAKVQGVSVNTANTRLNRGRLAMKSSIEKYEKKHGIRLHTIAFFPFFRWLLKGTEEVMPDKATVHVAQSLSVRTGMDVVVNASTAGATAFGAATTPNAGSVIAGTGLKSVITGTITKVAAGIAAVSVTFGSIALYQTTRNSEESTAPQIMQAESIDYNNSQENKADIDIQSTTPVDPQQNVYTCYEAFLSEGVSQEGFAINYYAYFDIDQDGTPELIVADYDGTPSSWTTWEVYAYQENSMFYCGVANSRYDNLYYINNSYVLGKHRLGNAFISPEECFNVSQHYNDPAISRNSGDWESISEDEFNYYMAETGGFIKQAEIITLRRNDFLQTEKLSQILDFSKAWSHQEATVNGKYTTVYAFDETGNFYCMFGFELSDIITCYQGIYTFDGETLRLCYRNNQGSFVCDYLIDPATLEMTQLSDNGIMNIQQKGDTYQLHTDEWNDPNRVKDMYNLVIGD